MDPLETPLNALPETTQEESVIGYCRSTGRPLTQSTVRYWRGVMYSDDGLPPEARGFATAQPEPPSPYAIPAGAAMPPFVTAGSGVSPALAFILGFIPGVGAIYNGQYAKGFAHVVIFGVLVSILSSGLSDGLEALFGMTLAAFVFYQSFEAFHTAKRRQMGLPVDEFSSILPAPAPGASPAAAATRNAVGPVILIFVGVMFLLSNLGLLRVSQILRWWPVIPIIVGISLLASRMSANRNRGNQ